MSVILDPTDERQPVTRRLAPRPARLDRPVALLDISKAPGNVLVDRLAELLGERLPGLQINRYVKPTFAKPAPADLRREIAEKNGFVIEALAD